jgi:NAD(P)-dependent dehydrogenase (short-subunit alcohol dehydrogenase family)
MYQIVAVYRTRPPRVPSQNQWYVDPMRPRRALDENHPRIFEIRADLTRDGQIEHMIDVALARFGRIDLVVNAAGLALDAPLLDTRRFEAAWMQQLLINATLPMRIASAVASKLWRAHPAENRKFNRNVINVSSTSGLFIYSRPQRGAYAASKAALNFLSCHLAAEFKRFNARVNVVAPTTFPTLIATERVVKAIVGIDDASWNGRVLMLNVNGNRLM